ncbi:sugar transporter SWEET1 isoform X2 [Cololabis saira]|uniref:sugar transporter SWEET1 isoform X2 n=1 Tax=Cololabis saira TaxID=129043 RepID=UPI002AD40F78|nr:sugar transporter SWEET1 isoform X2 [Cololabis saira]
MDLLQLLSWACIVFTVGMFSTGLTDLKKMRESKSTDNIQFLPFLTTCLNNLGWLFYGVLKRDHTIIFVNIIGAVLQSLYIIMYFNYTKHKRLVTVQTVAAVAVLFIGWLYFTTFLTEGESRLNQLGLTCSVVTVSMYLSPLIDLFHLLSCLPPSLHQHHSFDCPPVSFLPFFLSSVFLLFQVSVLA